MATETGVSGNLVIPNVHDGLFVACAGREVGNVDPRFSTDWAENRDVFFGHIGISAAEVAVIGMDGNRGAQNNFVDMGHDDAPDEDIVTDALITARQGIGVMLNPADCLPLVVYAPDARVTAMVHLGFKGIDLGLHDKVLKHITRVYDANPAKMKAYLGPSIGQESYIRPASNIPEDQRFDERWKNHIRPVGEDSFSVNFPGVVKQDLARLGVAQIHDSGINVGANHDYFSFTRHKSDGVENGRNANIAVMIDTDL